MIVSLSFDVSVLWPVGFSVAEIEPANIPDGVDINGGWVFNGKDITQRAYTKEESAAQAEKKRTELMVIANKGIAPLQDAVDIDDASEKEVALLKAWKTYRVALNRLDLSTAPDIIWPAAPQSE